MNARHITDGISWVGAVDWDRRLFDELIPLPDGTSYNAYVVKGTEKTALIDSVDPPMADTLFGRLKAAGVEKVDYVVSHHAEQDHSGAIPDVVERFPEAQVVATERGRTLLTDLLDIPTDRFIVAKDGDRLSLGDCTLQFVHFPWVHWPETMLTWVAERRVLFSCDLFGSHLATGDLFADDEAQVMLAAKRYYAEIMMPFAGVIAKNLPKLDAFDIEFIAPSHGPVYRRPSLIVEAYREWLSAPPKNFVVVPYVSMHDSTRRMVEHFVEACVRHGVRAEQFNLAEPDIGKLAMMLVDAATIVVATPTVLNGAHPKVANAVYLANLLRPKARYLSVIGSYGWGGKTVEQLGAMIPNLKVEVLPPVLSKGVPKQADFEGLDRLAEEIAKKHASL
jgi:flavorubredoxin